MVALTVDVELGALVEESKTLGTVLAAQKVGESTSQRTAGDVGGVTAGVGDVVAAGHLGLVTASSLSFLDSHVLLERPERLLSAGLRDLLAVGFTLTAGAHVGQSNHRGSESEDGSGELHFECVWRFGCFKASS